MKIMNTKSLLLGLFVLLLVVTGCTHKEKKENDEIKSTETPQETTTEDVVDESKIAAVVLEDGDRKILVSERFGFRLPFPKNWEDKISEEIKNGVLVYLRYRLDEPGDFSLQVNANLNEYNKIIEDWVMDVDGTSETVDINGRRMFVVQKISGYDNLKITSTFFTTDYRNYFLSFVCSNSVLEGREERQQELQELCDKTVKGIEWLQK